VSGRDVAMTVTRRTTSRTSLGQPAGYALPHGSLVHQRSGTGGVPPSRWSGDREPWVMVRSVVLVSAD